MPDKRAAPSDGSDEPQRDSIEIHAAWRWVAAALGATGLGAGGAAVFITHLEAGPVAIIVVGVLFSIVAMGGRLPWQIEIAGNKIHMGREMAAARHAVVERFAEADPEQPSTQRALKQLASDAPSIAAEASELVGYKRMVLTALNESAERLNAQILETPINAEAAGIDAILSLPTSSHRVAVMINLDRPLLNRRMTQLANHLQQIGPIYKFDEAIVLSPGFNLYTHVLDRGTEYVPPPGSHIFFKYVSPDGIAPAELDRLINGLLRGSDLNPQ